MDGLVKLSLQDNDIEQIDLTDFRWWVYLIPLSHPRHTLEDRYVAIEEETLL